MTSSAAWSICWPSGRASAATRSAWISSSVISSYEPTPPKANAPIRCPSTPSSPTHCKAWKPEDADEKDRVVSTVPNIKCFRADLTLAGIPYLDACQPPRRFPLPPRLPKHPACRTQGQPPSRPGPNAPHRPAPHRQRLHRRTAPAPCRGAAQCAGDIGSVTGARPQSPPRSSHMPRNFQANVHAPFYP